MKFAKVMFLHLSVSHSVHREGGSSVPACTTGYITRGGLCPGEGLCPVGSVSGGLCPDGQVSVGGSLSRVVSVRETPTGQRPPPIR